ncbi:MAG TPA: flagellar FlbD family protein [Terracidiphilus sp.]|nr:flagellar FlbD family protein [Terracidiphilus sp.]
MIEVTRLNGTRMLLNSDLVKMCEASPDSMITLLNGEKLIVREDLTQIRERMLAYRAQLLAAVVDRARNEPAAPREAVTLAEASAAADLTDRTTANVLRWDR